MQEFAAVPRAEGRAVKAEGEQVPRKTLVCREYREEDQFDLLEEEKGVRERESGEQ